MKNIKLLSVLVVSVFALGSSSVVFGMNGNSSESVETGTTSGEKVGLPERSTNLEQNPYYSLTKDKVSEKEVKEVKKMINCTLPKEHKPYIPDPLETIEREEPTLVSKPEYPVVPWKQSPYYIPKSLPAGESRDEMKGSDDTDALPL